MSLQHISVMLLIAITIIYKHRWTEDNEKHLSLLVNNNLNKVYDFNFRVNVTSLRYVKNQSKFKCQKYSALIQKNL